MSCVTLTSLYFTLHTVFHNCYDICYVSSNLVQTSWVEALIVFIIGRDLAYWYITLMVIPPVAPAHPKVSKSAIDRSRLEVKDATMFGQAGGNICLVQYRDDE
jgi:hypothetical protein